MLRQVAARHSPCRASGLVAYIGVEVAAVAGGGDEAGANGEIAEALALLPLGGVGSEDRIERGDERAMLEILGIELVHARAVEGGAEIEVVAARPFADQADLGVIRPRAAPPLARSSEFPSAVRPGYWRRSGFDWA